MMTEGFGRTSTREVFSAAPDHKQRNQPRDRMDTAKRVGELSPQPGVICLYIERTPEPSAVHKRANDKDTHAAPLLRALRDPGATCTRSMSGTLLAL